MPRFFSAAALAVSLAVIPACGGRPASSGKVTTVDPVIDPADPSSLARWEASEYNVDRSKLEVVGVACFRDKMTERGYPEAKPVAIEMRGSLDYGVTGEQAEALGRFKAAERELYARARAAIYEEYKKSYNDYKQGWLMGASMFGVDQAEIQKVLPKIVKGDELDGLVSFNTISVSRPRDGASRIIVDLYCPWDEEHGMEVVIANGEVERVGIDASFQ